MTSIRGRVESHSKELRWCGEVRALATEILASKPVEVIVPEGPVAQF